MCQFSPLQHRTGTRRFMDKCYKDSPLQVSVSLLAPADLGCRPNKTIGLNVSRLAGVSQFPKGCCAVLAPPWRWRWRWRPLHLALHLSESFFCSGAAAAVGSWPAPSRRNPKQCSCFCQTRTGGRMTAPLSYSLLLPHLISYCHACPLRVRALLFLCLLNP